MTLISESSSYWMILVIGKLHFGATEVIKLDFDF